MQLHQPSGRHALGFGLAGATMLFWGFLPHGLQLTLAELAEIPDETRAYEQLGKMFILRPLADLKDQLLKSSETAQTECKNLTDKKEHIEAAYKKIQEDFQDFVKSHMVEAKEEGKDEKKE